MQCLVPTQPLQPTAGYLCKNTVQRLRNSPGRILCLHFSQIAVVTDMIACPVLSHLRPSLRLPGNRFPHAEGLYNRARIPLAAPDVIHFSSPRSFVELVHESRDVFGMNVVPNLLALVPEYLVLPLFEIAPDQ